MSVQEYYRAKPFYTWRTLFMRYETFHIGETYLRSCKIRGGTLYSPRGIGILPLATLRLNLSRTYNVGLLRPRRILIRVSLA